jgi:hypothetical protein
VTRACSIFLLVLGVLWAFGFVWFWLVMTGITDFTSRTAEILYWPVTLAAPMMLIVGSALLLRNRASKIGAWMSIVGVVIYTGFALYNSADVLRPLKPLEPAPAYWFYGLLLVLMAFSDLAAFRIYKLTRQRIP